MGHTVVNKRFLDLIDEHEPREAIDVSFNFTEGPIWHPVEQHVTFSDIPENRLYRWNESEGITIYREPTNMANGNTYDRSGRILSCEHASSQVRRDDNGAMTVLASHFEGKELNSPNDIIVRGDGMVFFTDPAYGRKGNHGVPREQELDFQGVYQLHPDTLELTLLTKELSSPNGLCLGLDESVLFVADTRQRQIRRFEITNGGLKGGEVFAESPAPDGLKIDSLGNLDAGGPGGVYVYDKDDGSPLGVIEAPDFCANFTWGGADMLTLFMTASVGFYRTRVKVPGLRLF